MDTMVKRVWELKAEYNYQQTSQFHIKNKSLDRSPNSWQLLNIILIRLSMSDILGINGI